MKKGYQKNFLHKTFDTPFYVIKRPEYTTGCLIS